MVKVHTSADLIRLKQFLRTLEDEEADIGPGEGNEIEMLKREIAYLEGVLYPSKAFLLREIAIDYGASLGAR